MSASDYVERDIATNCKGKFLRIKPDIPIDKRKAELDNTEPKVLKIYKDASLQAAMQAFSKDFRYGQFNDRTFVEWLAENTARKMEQII